MTDETKKEAEGEAPKQAEPKAVEPEPVDSKPPEEIKTAGKPQETEAIPTEQAQTESAKPQSAGGGGSAAIIIIIIILVVVVLGVGGYFGWKYLAKKTVPKIGTTKTATVTATASTAGKMSVNTVIKELTYPGSSITDQKQGEKDSVYKAELTLSSPDGVATIKSYYQKLAADKKWQVTRQGSNDENNSFMTVTDGTFTAEIDVTKYQGYDTTDITIKISGDELTSESISISPTTATKTSAKTATSTVASGDYIISDSNTRTISESDLTSLNAWKLKVARNEIYARYGRPFVHKDLQCYFAKKSWYSEDPNATNPSLSSIESANVATIQAYETKIGSGLASSDSGCDTNE